MISMHAAQPGTRRRTLAKPIGGRSHSTIIAYEGDENEVTQAMRKAERPSSNNMALFAKPRAHFGIIAGARNPCHARQRDVAPSETVEEQSVTASLEARQEDRPLVRRMNRDGGKEQWTQRGMFKLGFNSGSPRVRSARKFTK